MTTVRSVALRGAARDVLHRREKEDYSWRLAAFEAARKSDIEIRKLYGLDSPTKIEQSGSVRYEVLGVDIELLS